MRSTNNETPVERKEFTVPIKKNHQLQRYKGVVFFNTPFLSLVALQPIKVYFLGNLDLCRVFYIFETTIQKNAIGVACIYELVAILPRKLEN